MSEKTKQIEESFALRVYNYATLVTVIFLLLETGYEYGAMKHWF